MTKKHQLGAFTLALLTGAAMLASSREIQAKEAPPVKPAQVRPVVAEAKPDKKAVEKKPAVEPKPLGDSVKTGLDWLVKNQLKDGSWGQGDESSTMNSDGDAAYQGNVADSAIAVLALYRSGSTPAEGPYKENIQRGIAYVIGQVNASDKDSLFVTDVRGTRVQSKIGTYVDTFLANLMLAELKGHMGNPEANKNLEVALNKVISKIRIIRERAAAGTTRAGRLC